MIVQCTTNPAEMSGTPNCLNVSETDIQLRLLQPGYLDMKSLEF